MHYIIDTYLHLLWLPSYFTHFNIYYNSSTHHLPMHKLISKIFSRQMTYLYTFTFSYILRVFSCISWIPNSFTLSLSRLTLRVQTLSLTSHTSIHTHASAYFFMLGFNIFLLQHSLMFHDIGLLSRMDFHTYTKFHITTSRKLILKKNYWLDSSPLVLPLYTYIDK